MTRGDDDDKNNDYDGNDVDNDREGGVDGEDVVDDNNVDEDNGSNDHAVSGTWCSGFWR